MVNVVLVRHGQSAWNFENRFTGWADAGLSASGIQEATSAARLLVEGHYTFDIAYTSLLKRAIKSLWIILEEMDLMWIPVHKSWRLNERHYGAFEGLSKSQMAARHGADQVLLWQRGYDPRLPELDRTDSRYPGKDPRYADLEEKDIPLSESLKDTVERLVPYWHNTIVPALKTGRKALLVAHGNSLRALVMYLDSIPKEEIIDLNIPTGIPLVYELDDNLKVITHYYLGDPEAAKRAAEAVTDYAGQ